MKQKAMGAAHIIPTPRTAWGMHPVDVGGDLETEMLGFRLVYDSAERVDRGGSWFFDPSFARVAIRNVSAPGNRFNFLGFRLAREVE